MLSAQPIHNNSSRTLRGRNNQAFVGQSGHGLLLGPQASPRKPRPQHDQKRRTTPRAAQSRQSLWLPQSTDAGARRAALHFRRRD
eukprot:267159-Alexandrium_andersonii.AAC.1